MPSTFVGSILIKNIESGEEDFKKYLDLRILLANLFQIVQKCLSIVSEILLFSVIFAPSANRRLIIFGSFIYTSITRHFVFRQMHSYSILPEPYSLFIASYFRVFCIPSTTYLL